MSQSADAGEWLSVTGRNSLHQLAKSVGIAEGTGRPTDLLGPLQTLEPGSVVPKTPDKRNLRRIRTREKLYEAAIALFAERDFDTTTMGDIAARAGIGRSTLFLHFETKLDFLREFYKRFVDEVIIAARSEWIGDYRNDLDRLLREWGEQAELHAPIVRHLAGLTLGHGPLAAEEGAADRALGAVLRECLRSANPGSFSSEIEEDEHVELLVAMLTVTSHDWVNTGMTRALPDLLIRRFAILHSGLDR